MESPPSLIVIFVSRKFTDHVEGCTANSTVWCAELSAFAEWSSFSLRCPQKISMPSIRGIPWALKQHYLRHCSQGHL